MAQTGVAHLLKYQPADGGELEALESGVLVEGNFGIRTPAGRRTGHQITVGRVVLTVDVALALERPVCALYVPAAQAVFVEKFGQ